MSERRGLVRSEDSLRKGLERLRELGERTAALEVRPDIAGYADLAHAFDLQASLLAAARDARVRAQAARDTRRPQPRRLP